MGYKTIKRDEGGNWQPIDAKLGPGQSVGKNEINKRAALREQELKDAIAKDSSKPSVAGDTLQHAATDSAVARLKADRDRTDAETNAKESDKPELTPRKMKRT